MGHLRQERRARTARRWVYLLRYCGVRESGHDFGTERVNSRSTAFIARRYVCTRRKDAGGVIPKTLAMLATLATFLTTFGSRRCQYGSPVNERNRTGSEEPARSWAS